MIWSFKFLNIFCLSLTFNLINAFQINNKVWRTCFVESRDLEPSSGFQKEEHSADSLMRCNMIANENPWARLMCHSGSKCVLSDMAVLPSFHPQQDLTNPAACMTTEFTAGGISTPKSTAVNKNSESTTLNSKTSTGKETTVNSETTDKMTTSSEQQQTTSTEVASETQTGMTSTSAETTTTAANMATTTQTQLTDTTFSTVKSTTANTAAATGDTTTTEEKTTVISDTTSTTSNMADTSADTTTTTPAKLATTSTEELTTTTSTAPTTTTTAARARPALKKENFITRTSVDYESSKSSCAKDNASPFVPKSQDCLLNPSQKDGREADLNFSDLAEYDFLKRQPFPTTPSMWFPLTDLEKEGVEVYEDGTAYNDNPFAPPKWDKTIPNDESTDCVTFNTQTDIFTWSLCSYTSAIPLVCVKNDYTEA